MLVSSHIRATLHPVSQISVYLHSSRALQHELILHRIIYLQLRLVFQYSLHYGAHNSAKPFDPDRRSFLCFTPLFKRLHRAPLPSPQSELHNGLKFTNESTHGLFTASPRKHPSTTKFDIKAAPPKVMRVAMAVIVSKDSVFWRSLQTHEDYARRWNYRSHILTETFTAEEPWSRFQEFR